MDGHAAGPGEGGRVVLGRSRDGCAPPGLWSTPSLRPPSVVHRPLWMNENVMSTRRVHRLDRELPLEVQVHSD